MNSEKGVRARAGTNSVLTAVTGVPLRRAFPCPELLFPELNNFRIYFPGNNFRIN